MKRIINYQFIFSIGIFSLLCSAGNAQEPIWAKVVSGSAYEYGVDADIDSQGNVFFIGYGTGPTLVMDSIYHTNGDGDAFIGKLSPHGQLLWFRTLGGDDNVYFDEAMDIHVDDNDDVIILVRSSGNNFTYNGDTLSGINSRGQYGGEGVIIKVDNKGNYQWHDDGSVSSSFQDVTTDSTGNIYLTGWFSTSLTLGDTLQLTNTTNGTTVDMFVAKYSPAGVLLWGKNAGGTEHNAFAYGHNIEIDEPSGKIVIIGRFNKDINFDTGVLSTSASYATFLIAYNTNGTELWRTSIFNNNSSYCHGLDISSNGLIGIAGFNSLASSPDGLVGFYDLNGDLQSEETYSSPTYCRLHSLEFNYLDECYISGEFQNSLSIGAAPNNITINAKTSNSGLILKLNANQIPIWANQRPTTSENKITCKNYRTLFSCRIDDPFIYNFGANTITNNAGDAVFAEISDTACPVVLITDNQTACDSYIWMDGHTYSSNNDTSTYYIPREGPNSCDTLITLNLTINKVSDVSTSVNQTTITANNTSASYKWLDCNNNYMIIPGETSRSYTATANGKYAVHLTENGCVDTSECVAILYVGIIQNDFGNALTIYPNPSRGNFSIDLVEIHQDISLTIKDLNGKTIQSKTYSANRLLNLDLEESAGVYLLIIESENKRATIRLVID